MKSKQYQRIDMTIPSGESLVFIKEQLRPDYKYATGLFFFSDKPLTGITCQLKIDNVEILPQGSDLSLFRWTDGISRNEALWDFSEDMILGAEKTIEILFDTNGGTTQNIDLSLMVLLKND